MRSWAHLLPDKQATKSNGVAEVEIGADLAALSLNAVALALFGSAYTEQRAGVFVKTLKSVIDSIAHRIITAVGFTPVLKNLPISSRRTLDSGCKVLYEFVSDVLKARKSGQATAVGGRTLLTTLTTRLMRSCLPTRL